MTDARHMVSCRSLLVALLLLAGCTSNPAQMTDAGSNPPDTTDAQSGGDATDTRDADIDTQLPPPDADASEELSQDDWREDRPCRKRLQLATHQGEYFVPPGGAEQAPPDDDDAAAFIGGEANYSHQIPASDLHASPLPENLWPDEEGEVRIHGLFVHNYAESPSGHVLVTAMVDFQPVEFKLEVFDATRESILSSTISTGAVVERDGRLFVYDIVIPQTNFEWGRLYDVEILVISIGEGNSVPLQRQERYSLVYGGWNALSGVEDICFDDPVESIPNETEDDVWGRGLSAFHEEAAAVITTKLMIPPAAGMPIRLHSPSATGRIGGCESPNPRLRHVDRRAQDR